MDRRSTAFNSNPLFGHMPIELTQNLRELNPWWAGKPGPVVPGFRRWPFSRLLQLVQNGIAPATVLRGPRRVGKTVLIRQVMQSLLDIGVAPERLLYVPFDELPSLRGIREPVLAISRWHQEDILRSTYNELAVSKTPAYIFLDEVQNLDAWAPQVKNLVDNHSVRAVVTGSSSLRIEAGRDSLAGRIISVDLGPLLLREIAGLMNGETYASLWPSNGSDELCKSEFWRNAISKAETQVEVRSAAFKSFSERGSYPIAQEQRDLAWPELAAYLNETVVRRAIQHDLRMGPRGQKRDERLLEEVFRLCCRYAGQTPGQSVFVPEINEVFGGGIGSQRILKYLSFLNGTMLLKMIPAMEMRLKKKKSPSKICLCDHALRASWLQEVIPMDPAGLAENPHLTDLAGRIAESTLGYALGAMPNVEIAHFPERGIEPEVDFVLTVGTKRIPIEVKYRNRIDKFQDTRGLRAFLEKTVYNAPFGILVTLHDGVKVDDPRIFTIPLSSFLWFL
ncbi:MAG: ATP-binding protein [Planctomycetota bacterium]